MSDQRSARDKAHTDALRLAGAYSAFATLWILLSDRLVVLMGLPPRIMEYVNSGKGLAFVLVTASVAYTIAKRHMFELYAAQDALRRRDKAIRQAYIDVLAAVTGGKLVLMSPEEIRPAMGHVISPPQPVTNATDIGPSKAHVAEAIRPLAQTRSDDVMLAASEAITNAVKHGGGGRFTVSRTDTALQIAVDDDGPGIDFHTLPKATLVPGFSTKPSLGMGFTIMLELTDRVLLATEPGRTIVVLEFDLGANGAVAARE